MTELRLAPGTELKGVFFQQPNVRQRGKWTAVFQKGDRVLHIPIKNVRTRKEATAAAARLLP